MSYLGRKFLAFLLVMVVFFGSVYVSYRCGYRQGMVDAPRHYYSFDVMKALRTSPQFKAYVDSLYMATYRGFIDSLMKKDDVAGMVGRYRIERPNLPRNEIDAMRADQKKKLNELFMK